MNVSLPDELKTFVDAQVDEGKLRIDQRVRTRPDPTRPRPAPTPRSPPRRRSLTTRHQRRRRLLRPAASPSPGRQLSQAPCRSVSAPSQPKTSKPRSTTTVPRPEPDTALAFIESLETAIEHLTRHPFTGSLRFAFELEIPDLRSWRLEPVSVPRLLRGRRRPHRHLARAARPQRRPSPPRRRAISLTIPAAAGCTHECVGRATLTQSTRAPWSAELVAA